MRIVSLLLLSVLHAAVTTAQDGVDCGVTCAQRAVATKASLSSEGDGLRNKLSTLEGVLGSTEQAVHACNAEMQQVGKGGRDLAGDLKLLEADLSMLKKREAEVARLEGELKSSQEETAKLTAAEQEFRESRLPEAASFRKNREEVQRLLKEKKSESTKLKEAIAVERDTPAPYVNFDAIQRYVKEMVDSLTGKK